MWWKKEDLTTHSTYHESQLVKSRGSTPLEILPFTVLDTETTGFDVKEDSIISIGVVRIENEEIIIKKSHEWNFNFDSGIDKEHISIHQITPNHQQLSAKEQLSEFLDFIGNSILVGHNVSFDISMLNEAVKQHFGFRLLNATLDTAKLAIRLDHGTGERNYKANEYGLDALCKRFNILPHDRHHAAGDAFITALLLLKLLHTCKKKGIKTKAQLVKKRTWLL